MAIETQLLLWAVRQAIRPADDASIDSLVWADINWADFLQMAHRHGVQQLLGEPLRHLGSTVVLDEVFKQLDAYVYQNTAHSVFLTGKLIKIMHLFQKHHIRAMAFKGPTLAVQLYGDVGRRRYGDLDILVRRDDVQPVKSLLASLDYEPTVQLTVARERVLLKTENALGFVSTVDQSLVEIHWALSPKYLDCDLVFEDLWASSVPTYPGGGEVRTFTPEPLLLFLCVQGAKHHWEALGWIVDIAKLVQVHERLDWRLVMSEAERLGLRRIVGLGLALAKHLVGAALPPQVWHWVQADEATILLSTELGEGLLRPSLTTSGVAEQLRFLHRVRERWQDRFRSYVHLTVTPSLADWAWVPLPANLAFLSAIPARS